MKISNRIKQLRLESEYTQKQLSDKIGLTPKMISFYENGERIPPIDILLKLVQIFSVSSDYLLGLTDKRIPDEDSEWQYPPVSNRLGNILISYRKKNNLSEIIFSEKLGIAIETYTGIEIGKYTPSLDLLQKLSKITGYNIDYFTGAIDHVSTPSNKTININGKEVPVFCSESNNHFKARFEELCLRENIDQTNVKKHLDLTTREFNDIRLNRMPTLSELLKISYGLGVSMDYLIGKTDVKLSFLNKDELELILNYRECLPNYKDNIKKRAEDLSIESIQNNEDSSVAADEPLRKAK